MLLFKIKPQFRSIIPCEVLLYLEVTFLGIYPLIWGFSGILGLKDLTLAGLPQITF